MQKVMKKHTLYPIGTFLLLALVLLSFYRIDRLSEGVRDGLSICASAIIPTIFPFLILSDLLLSFQGTRHFLLLLSRPFARILKLSPEGGSVFLLGTVFGFPIGAKTATRYYQEGAISKTEAERLLLFSNNASPFFLIGSVGAGMLFSVKSGIFLYLLQVSVSFLFALILSFKAKAPTENVYGEKLLRTHTSFPIAVQNAVKQTLFICGYILFFSAMAALILPDIRNNDFSCFLLSFLEIGNATSKAAALGGRYAIPFCAFSASFSGLSVYFQTLDVIATTDLCARSYLPVKFLSGAAAFFAALFFVSRN